MFPFNRKKKKTYPEKTPMWFKWVFGVFIVYALVTNISAAIRGENPLPELKEPGQTTMFDFMPVKMGKNAWGGKPLPFMANDIRQGDGKRAMCRDTVTVRYREYRDDGSPVTDHSEAEKTATFTIGKGQVIPALERGVMGMLVGGERRIVSQPALAYGAPGFNHPVLGDTDYVGFHATLDAVMAGPAAPESEGVLKTYDDEEGKGPLAQCTDRVLIGVAAQDAAGQPLWEGMREATVLLGSGEIAYAIEQAAIGMRAGGKRTVIAPPEFLLPLSVVSVGEQDEKPSNPFPELTGQSQMVILEVRVYPSMATYKP